MKIWKKIVIGFLILFVIFIILNFFGLIKVNLTQRYIYETCASGCNTNTNDVNDCIGFLAYLKENDQKFVSAANIVGINLNNPDKVTKTVSVNGEITCQYYAN